VRSFWYFFQYRLFPILKKSNNECHEIWDGDDVNRTCRVAGSIRSSIASSRGCWCIDSIKSARLSFNKLGGIVNVLFTSTALYCAVAWPRGLGKSVCVRVTDLLPPKRWADCRRQDARRTHRQITRSPITFAAQWQHYRQTIEVCKLINIKLQLWVSRRCYMVVFHTFCRIARPSSACTELSLCQRSRLVSGCFTGSDLKQRRRHTQPWIRVDCRGIIRRKRRRPHTPFVALSWNCGTLADRYFKSPSKSSAA